ncbi:MAG TPA: hypothetical protein DEH25_14455 [Chloroflexi bacterium]|nr:hypothetical protein [Chloroflexota bacterium]HBY06377.1 hypothetical protein [Chloroflexota bacterium]
MSDNYFDPITPEASPPKNNTTKIIIIVAVVVVLCICICLCAIVLVPALLGPVVGNTFSEIENQLLLTPIP